MPLPKGQTYTSLLTSASSSQAFLQASPSDRINTILSIRSPPEDPRFLSQFLEKDVRLESVVTTTTSSSSASSSPSSPKVTKATFSFRVERFYCNSANNLHGGAAAAIYDVLTSLALQSIAKNPEGDGGGGSGSGSTGGTSAPLSWINGGVSRTLNVTYLRPAPEGLEIKCEVEVVQAGKTLAFLRGRMVRAGDGVVVSVCEHNKAATGGKGGVGAVAAAVGGEGGKREREGKL